MATTAVPNKRKKISENGNSDHRAPVKHCAGSNNGVNGANRTIHTAPKILTARKRTKNGALKAPTELWLV